MYFVYILFSSHRDKYYVGSSCDPESRLVKHNTNHHGFTGRTGDWEIKHKEEFSTKAESLKRESKSKAGKADR